MPEPNLIDSNGMMNLPSKFLSGMSETRQKEVTTKYEVETQCTLDSWMYLAKRRLDEALARIPEDSPAKFTVRFKHF